MPGKFLKTRIEKICYRDLDGNKLFSMRKNSAKIGADENQDYSIIYQTATFDENLHQYNFFSIFWAC